MVAEITIAQASKTRIANPPFVVFQPNIQAFAEKAVTPGTH
jgi:hypothetical protein